MTIAAFSQSSLALLQSRDFSAKEINAYQTILSKAEAADLSAKSFLQTLTAAELSTLQKASGLVERIAVDGLSDEGASNLLAQPDGTDLVDLNNDGIVEIGIGRSILFPPVNAPAHITAAWEHAAQGLDPYERATVELTMHHMIYGIAGMTITKAQSPAVQWSGNGIDNFFADLYGNLDFRVGFDGWTEYNLMLKGTYERFASALGKAEEPPLTTSHFETQSRPSNQALNSTFDSNQDADEPLLQTMIELLLDARLGIDRDRLEALEKERQAILTDSSLTPKQREGKLEAIQTEIEAVIARAREKMLEEEQRKTSLLNYDGFATIHNKRIRWDE